MEEKESTVSGSLGNSDTDSPPPPVSSLMAPVSSLMPPEVMNMVIERTINGVGAAGIPVSGAATAASGGGGAAAAAGGVDSSGKKKRGRPRKYDADGNLRLTYQVMTSSSPGFTLSPSSPPEYSSSKRGRGRPAGSGNWQILASLGELFANTAGGDFTPHIVTVNTGEDVAEKILSFSQKGPRGICVLSANGAVSNVTLRQPGSSGGILTYEGRFEILSLTGSYTVSDAGGMKSRTGCMSVSLAGPDGRVIGGGLAGILVAASPIQIVVGSFLPNGFKVHNKRKHYRESNLSPQGAPNLVTAAVPISEAKPDSEGTYIASPSPFLGQSHGQPDSNITTNNQQIPSFMSSSHNVVWNGSDPSSIQRPSPDINISVTGE